MNTYDTRQALNCSATLPPVLGHSESHPGKWLIRDVLFESPSLAEKQGEIFLEKLQDRICVVMLQAGCHRVFNEPAVTSGAAVSEALA